MNPTSIIHQFVFPFGNDLPVPQHDKSLLGGKGKGLTEMASLKLPIPPGFIISTEACNAYRKAQRQFPSHLEEEILHTLKLLEEHQEGVFGSESNPLLVSVRSGARVSMPGMMDTVLNLGLSDQLVEAFAKKTGNPHLAYDSYRRLIMMYSDIVAKIDREHFVKVFETLKKREKVHHDFEVSEEGLRQATILFKQIYEQHKGQPFPQDPFEQLFTAIKAVFDSWDSERATLYRQIHHYPDDWGTAVTVQTMVFGNKNSRSATGVGFSRDPATGSRHFYGEFLPNAQGEEVVAGVRTPHPINKQQKAIMHSDLISLEEMMPEIYQQLREIVERLERHYKDMQDVEFTIDDGKLYMLQTRTGKRTGFSAIKIAVDMLEEGMIDEITALKRVQPEQLIQLLAPVFDNRAKLKAQSKMAAVGLNAGPGAASGKLVFSKEKALEAKQASEHCILVREETNPDDFPGMVAADGILTLRGGSTSHAAVVARGMGKPCVVGCGSLIIDMPNKILKSSHTANPQILKEGETISIDGSTGEVFFCELKPSSSEIVQTLLHKQAAQSPLFQQYKKIMDLADKYRVLGIRANADTGPDSTVARMFGAEGIGLCRTEHMFLEADRLNDVRRMFFSLSIEDRKKAIERLLPHQKGDFVEIFRAMKGLPVTIRLLDPPLHEFMPHTDDELKALAALMQIPYQQLAHTSAALEEQNPMLGHRGCRLGTTYPELTIMQTRAILEAALEVAQEGIQVFPEIMIPLVAIPAELEHQKSLIDETAKQIFHEKGQQIEYMVGTMIELPRAALLADQIAKEAEFFSFGTNDLTQTTFGISRDDGAKFVPSYVDGVANPYFPEKKVHLLKDDPFQVLDAEGVGLLMRIACEKGKSVRPDLKCGICGEHGGDPASVHFCHELKLDYVSCSPYRVPVAKLAAAQANLKDQKNKIHQ